jgi:tetratricopeptide (TPR) repeat protein
VQDYPESEFVPTAMYFVGSSYYDMEPKTPENMANAIAAFQKVLQEYPESDVAPWAHLGIVAAYESNGDYDMVVKVADEIETQYADSDIPDAKKVIDHARRRKVDAMLKLEEGVSTDALIAELRKVVNDPVGEESGKLAAQSRIGKLLFDDKRYEESIEEYEAILKNFPGKQDGAAYYQIAAAAYWIEDYDKAVASAQKGLQAQGLTQVLKTGLNYTLGLAQNKLANANGAIASLKQAIQVGTGSEDEGINSMVFAAHRELAGVYKSAKMYTEAVEEYKFLAENSPTDEEKADAYFWLARLYDENLQDYADAVNAYAMVKQLGTSDIMMVQSLYYSGIAYSTQLKDDANALASFQDLVATYSNSDDANIQSMVTDASLRIPELLVKSGKFDEAVAQARAVRDTKLASGTDQEKVNAQYQLAYLLGEQANKVTEQGSTNPELSREAATEYAKVYELVKSMGQVPDDTKSLAAASLYNAGYLLYGLETYDDYKQAVAYFESFTNDFPKSDSYSAALEYLGFATFEMARLKADLEVFAKAGDYFQRFANEFPNNDDAAMAQYQSGEAYFAVGGGYLGQSEETTDPNEKAREVALAADAYNKAASAYRKVVDNYSNSEYAPESLYAMAASYTYVSQALSDNAAKQSALNKMSDAYKELASKYPQSEHAAKAFLSVGNDYYNQAAAKGISNEVKTDLYKKSLDNYKKALQVPGIETKTKMSVEAFIRETEELLARDTYNAGSVLVPYDSEITEKRENAPKAIPYFEDVINNLPSTDYADLSYVQLGLCYEYLEKWQEAQDAYGELINKYMDENGNTISPFSDNVVQALQFAKDRKAKIMAYLISIKAREESQ